MSSGAHSNKWSARLLRDKILKAIAAQPNIPTTELFARWPAEREAIRKMLRGLRQEGVIVMPLKGRYYMAGCVPVIRCLGLLPSAHENTKGYLSPEL